jgi:hypothetical protein
MISDKDMEALSSRLKRALRRSDLAIPRSLPLAVQASRALRDLGLSSRPDLGDSGKLLQAIRTIENHLG